MPDGNSAIHLLMDSEKSVTDLHGIPFEAGPSPSFPCTILPSALYTFQLRKVMEEDFKKLRGLLDSLSG